MFRRNQRTRFTVNSRSARRIIAAAERSRRKSSILVQSIQRRAERIARWRSEFSFMPLNFARFLAVFSALTQLLAYERTQVGYSRSGMVRWGGGRKNASARQSGRSKTKTADAVSYQTLEDRAMLASLVASQFAETTEFVDISTTGTALFGGTEDDSTATFTSTFGNSHFPAGNIEVSTNGVLSSGPAVTTDWTNTALPTGDFGTGTDQNLLLPFWDDLDLDVADANVFWEELQIGGVDALVVQWDQISRFSTSPSEATFQVQVFDSGATPFRFVYQDTDFERADADFGAGATVGYQDSNTDFLQFSLNSPNSIPSNTVVSFTDQSIVPSNPGIEFELANSARGEEGVGGTVPTLLVGLDLSNATPAERTVNFSLTAGTATPGVGDDFTIDLSFTIPEGDYSNAIERFDLTRFDPSGFEMGEPGFSSPVIEIFQDNLVEGTEAFSFNITNGLGTALNVADVNGDFQERDGTNHFIVDDDLVRFTVNEETVTEGETVSGTINVESSDDNGVTWVPGLAAVNLLAGSQISFDLVDAGTGDATDPADFSFTTQTYTILPGFSGTSLSFTLPTVNDSLVEGTEAVDLSIQNVRSVTLASTSDPLNTQVVTEDATITILDNDAVEWNIAQDVSEVIEGGQVTYTISLDGSGSGAGPFVLQDGDTASVAVSLMNLGTDGGDYSALGAAINNAVNAFNGANPAGAAGTFSYVPGTLTWNGDSATAPELEFALTATDDALVEGNESYSINLATPGGSVTPIPPTVTIGNSSVETLITDNDEVTWNISQSASTVTEGGRTDYSIDLIGTGSAAAGGPFVLQLGETATVELSLVDIGTDSNDYSAFVSVVEAAVNAHNGAAVAGSAGTFGFVGGVLTYYGDGVTEPSLDFSLNAIDDSLVEGDESYSINLANPGGSVAPTSQTVLIGNGSVTTLIEDNDKVTWNIAASAETVVEGNDTDYTITLVGSGSGNAPFSLQSGDSASVKVSLIDLGTNAADYEALASAINDAVAAYNGISTEGDPNTFAYVPNGSMGVLTYFGDSQTSPSLTFSIDAVDDNLIEGHESYKIDLSEPGGSVTPIPPTVMIGDSATFTQIIDNDSAVWTLEEDTASLGQTDSTNGLVDEGDTARYRLTLDGSGSNSPGPAALQAGDTATIQVSLTLLGTTSLNDFDEDSDQSVNESNPLGQAIIDAVNAYNTAAGTSSGQNNSFSVDPASWVVTYHGDGATTAPQLVIDLNTFDDSDSSQGVGTDAHLANWVEPDESFQVSISDPSDSVGGSSPTIDGSGIVETTIVDNDTATLTVENVSVFETSAGRTLQVSITLDNPVQDGFTVDYNTADITATVADNDYLAQFGSVAFTGNAGESKSITIGVFGDDVVEPDETFQVELSNITPSDPNIDPASIGVAAPADGSGGVVTILNDDIDLAIEPTDTPIVTEGNSGVTTVSFEVTRAGIITDSTADTTVDWVVAGTGPNGVEAADFVGGVLPSGTLTFGPTELSKTIEIQVLAETLVERDESFTVTLSNALNADPNLDTLQINVDNQSATIVNDDTANVTIDDVIVQEPDGTDTAVASFTISIDQPADENITVLATTNDGTATTAGNDYVSNSQTVTILAGETTATFDVVVVGDDDVELDENFFVTLTDPTYDGINQDVDTGGPGGLAAGVFQVEIDDDTGIGTINNEDALIEFRDTSTEQGEDGSVSSVPVFGAAAVGGPTLVVSGDLTGTPEGSRIVTIQSINGTALRNLDFGFGDNVLLEEDFVVPALDYSINPGFFDLTLVNRFGAVATGVGNDQPVLDITDDSIIEGPESLIVEAQGKSNALQEGDADGDGDNLQDTTHIIVDNDTATISVVPTSILEEGGTQEFNVVLTTDNGLGGPAILGPGVDISVNVVDLLGANGGSAGTPDDYTYSTQTVSFFSGQGSIPVTRTLEITANDDLIVEPSETVNIGFDNLVAGIATSQVMLMTGDVTILDNDSGEVKLTVNSLIVNEDDGTASLDVTVDTAVSGGFTVDYTLFGGLAVGQGIDYGTPGVTGGTLTFAGALDETQEIIFPIIDDLTVEGFETFFVSLSNVTPLTADSSSLTLKPTADSALVGIVDNDSPALVSASITTVDESVGLATVTLTLNKAVQGGVSVDYTTVDASAQNGSDYIAVTGTANFAGNLNETITFTVPITDDNVLEANESLRIELSNAVPGGNVLAASIVTTDGQITIVDNEEAVNVTTSITTVDESTGLATVTLTLDNAVQGGFTVDYSTANGSATAGTDFSATDGTATFAGSAGEQVTFTVPILDDAVVEGTESLGIQLSNVVPGDSVSAADIGTTDGSIAITDDDAAATVSASVTTVSESSALVTLTLDRAVQGGFTVNYTTADGTAIAGSDYLTTAGVASFSGTVGETVTFVVPVINDNVVEGTESLSILLSNVVPGGITPASSINTVDGSVTILDDDGVANVRASVTTVDEHAGTATVVLTLENAIQGGLSVDYTTADGTATAGLDYTATSGTASFSGALGETVSFTVPINDDSIVEATEAFNIVLSNVVPGGNLPASSVALTDGSVSITDNDEATVSLTPTGVDTVSEPNGVRAYTLALDGASSSSTDTTVRFNTSGSALRFAGARADQVQDYAIWVDDGAGNFTNVTNSDTFTIPAGVGAVTVEIRVVDDVVVEFTEAVDLQLTGTAGDAVVAGDPEISLGSPLGGVTNILDNDEAQVVVKAFDPIAAETLETEPVNLGAFQVLVVVPGSVSSTNPFGTPAPLAFDLDVGFGISAGTAINGVDFDSIDGEVSFGIGDTVRTVNVTPIDDALPENAEVVLLALNPFDVTTDTPGAPIAQVAVVTGECDEAAVTILDNDNVSFPSVISVIRDGGDVSRPDLLTSLAVVFDRNVDVSVDALELFNESFGSTVDLAGVSFSYDFTTFTATWDFSTLSAPLAASFYTAAIDADDVVTSGTGASLARDFVHNEYVALVGDANLDGTVDVIGDGFRWVSNLGVASGATWQQADFNADGSVDVLQDGFQFIANLGLSVVPEVSGFATVSSAASSKSAASSVDSSASSPVVKGDALQDEAVGESQEQQLSAGAVESLSLAGSQSLDEAFASEDWLI